MNGVRRTVEAAIEEWPIRGSFTISRGSRNTARVVVVTLREGAAVGRGECVPYDRYDESCEAVFETVEALRGDLEDGLDRETLGSRLPPGAARNALDCALWDLDAKRHGTSVPVLAGRPPLRPVETVYTISLDTPKVMAAGAHENAHRPVLKLKLAGPEDLERVRAVRRGAPKARLIVDANEAWTPEVLLRLAPELAKLGVSLIEQPLPAGADEALRGLDLPVPVCADESCLDLASLDGLEGKYDFVNLKLEKTGGLTEALALESAALERGFRLMVGCMVSTSLAMAPALVVAQRAEIVDVDGPLLLARDREPGLRYDGSLVHPPGADLWG